MYRLSLLLLLVLFNWSVFGDRYRLASKGFLKKNLWNLLVRDTYTPDAFPVTQPTVSITDIISDRCKLSCMAP